MSRFPARWLIASRPPQPPRTSTRSPATLGVARRGGGIRRTVPAMGDRGPLRRAAAAAGSRRRAIRRRRRALRAHQDARAQRRAIDACRIGARWSGVSSAVRRRPTAFSRGWSSACSRARPCRPCRKSRAWPPCLISTTSLARIRNAPSTIAVIRSGRTDRRKSRNGCWRRCARTPRARAAGADLECAVAGWIAYVAAGAQRYGARWTPNDPFAGEIITRAERAGTFRELAQVGAEPFRDLRRRPSGGVVRRPHRRASRRAVGS